MSLSVVERVITMGRWSDPKLGDVVQLQYGSRGVPASDISDEVGCEFLEVLVSMSMFRTPKELAPIASETRVPLESWMGENHSGSWALKSPIIIVLLSVISMARFGENRISQLLAGGIYIFTIFILSTLMARYSVNLSSWTSGRGSKGIVP